MDHPLPRAGDRLGPYQLDGLLGRGASGEVWAARHADVDARVAVKVLLRATPEEVRREVRALAGLRHPGIVFPYDHGETDGRPWIAMERAGGSLADAPPRGWPAIRAVAEALLDALACAHAHGVVHRDVKARNVLVFAGEGVKLSDFGIARARGAQGAYARAGTPAGMAPEQLRGELGDQGPWTDLYGLGCLVYELLAGRPAFADPRGHLTEPPPRLPWPALDAWVGRLLAKEPGDRPRCAAEALDGMPDAAAGGPDGIVARTVAGPIAGPIAAAAGPNFAGTIAGTVAGTIAGHAATPTAKEPAGTAIDTPGSTASSIPAPPRRPAWHARMPTDWRPARPPPRILPGAGLGLLDVRPVPTVGRDEVLDELWSAVLRSVDGPTRAHVEGPAGCGRAHVLGHVAARAAERGATVWRLPRRAEVEALARAAAGLLEDDDEVATPLARTAWRAGLPPGTAAALVDPGRSPARRAEAARAFLLAGPAPRVVVAPEPGEDVAAVLRALDGPIAALTSGAPGAAPGATPIALDPLADDDIARILGELVELEPSLASVLVARAAGNPGAALGQVAAWARAGRLVPGPRGHELRGEAGPLDAADPEGAVDAALHWLRHGRQDRALPVLDAAIAALADRPPADPARLRALRMRLGVLLALGAWDDAEALARSLLAMPQLPASYRVIASTAVADVLTVRGRPADALVVLDVPAEGEDAGRLALYRAWARLALGRDLAASAAELEACLEGVDPRLRIALLRQRAILGAASGEPGARAWVDLALAEAPPERQPGLHGVAGDLSLLADDDPAAAEAAYTRALARTSPGDPNRLVVLVNRGVARLAAGDVEGARDLARQALPLLHRSGWRDHEAVAHALAWATEPDATVAAEHGARARATAGTNALTARLLARIEALAGRSLG